ncbi:exonuclease domain-containing protein [Membranihabitans marinus]|uniref:exonuclease domain-containing protein n=1 Tax=Membranihabitans marinus TaxID=1227546 RepID=UPI001F31D178|nr:exonuclease domain-containing protein [Membranihabitans marinus]
MSKPMRFAIIDIETTGGNYKTDRITEIGIAIHNGQEVVQRFESLINPCSPIPPFIQKLTGITNEMVMDAPEFYEVAKQIVELTEDCIFVAHNVKFDYYFIRMEFSRLGYTFSKKQLCTKQLTKKLFPEIGRYSLENLIRYFNISVSSRHRAMADVEATVVVFEELIQKDINQQEFLSQINNGIRLSKLPSNMTMDDLHRIPETCGIYFFYGENDILLYVGKSKNIQKRVLQHFKGNSQKSNRILERTKRIDFEETGSELLAMLKEDEMIKKLKPEYNVAQRKSMASYGIVIHSVEEETLISARPIREEVEQNFVKIFKNKSTAKHQLQDLIQTFKLSDYYEISNSKPEIKVVKKENNHNGILNDVEFKVKINGLINHLERRKQFHHIVIDHRYSEQEYSIFIFNKGILQGFGKFDKENGLDQLQLDHVQEVNIPLAINDQLIHFIQKKNGMFTLKPNQIQ